MMGNNFLSTISFSKILGGANKAITFANKALPLYYQLKPMIGNAKTILNMYSKMGNETKNTINDSINKKIDDINNNNYKKETIKEINNIKEKYLNDTLTFFN